MDKQPIVEEVFTESLEFHYGVNVFTIFAPHLDGGYVFAIKEGSVASLEDGGTTVNREQIKSGAPRFADPVACIDAGIDWIKKNQSKE